MANEIKTLELIEGKNLNLAVINDKAYVNTLYNSLDLATKDRNGLMSKEDKAKLDSTSDIIDKNNSLGSFTIRNTKISAIKKNDTFNISSDNNIKLTADNSNKSITIDLLPLDESGYADKYLSKEDKIKLDSINTKAEENQYGFNKIGSDSGILTAKFKEDVLNIITDENIEIIPSQSLKRLTISSKIPSVSATNDGLMTKEDKIRLDKIQNNSEVNQNAFNVINANTIKIEAKSKNDILRLSNGKDINLIGADHSNTIKIESSLTIANETKDGLISAIDKVKIDEIEVGSEKNQNAFEKIIVNTKELVANNKNDTLELEGKDGIILNSNIAKKSIEIGINLNAKDGINKTVDNSTGVITLEGISASNDNTFTDNYKTKLDGIENNAQVNQNTFTKLSINNNELKANNDNDTLYIDAILGKDGEIKIHENKIKIKSRAEKNKRRFKGIILNNNIEDATKKEDILTLMAPSNDTRKLFEFKLDNTNNTIELVTKAEKNQNAFSSLFIGGKTIISSEKKDGFTLVPEKTEINVTGNEDSKEITISLKPGVLEENKNKVISDIIVEGKNFKDRKIIEKKYSKFLNEKSNTMNIIALNGYSTEFTVGNDTDKSNLKIMESTSTGPFNVVDELPSMLYPKSFYLRSSDEKLFFGDYYYRTIEINKNGNKDCTSAKNIFENIFDVIEISSPLFSGDFDIKRKIVSLYGSGQFTVFNVVKNRCFYDIKDDAIILNNYHHILRISNLYNGMPFVERLSKGYEGEKSVRNDLIYMEKANLYICKLGFNMDSVNFSQRNCIQASRDLINWVTIYGDDDNEKSTIFTVCECKEGDNLLFMEANVKDNNTSSLFAIYFNGTNDDSPITKNDFIIESLNKKYDYSNIILDIVNINLVYMNNNLYRFHVGENNKNCYVERMYIDMVKSGNKITSCSINTFKSSGVVKLDFKDSDPYKRVVPNYDTNYIALYGRFENIFLKCNENEISSSSKYNIENFNAIHNPHQQYILYNEYTKMPAFAFISFQSTNHHASVNAYSKIDNLVINGIDSYAERKNLFDVYFNFLEIPFYNHQMMYFFQIYNKYYLLRPKYIYF